MTRLFPLRTGTASPRDWRQTITLQSVSSGAGAGTCACSDVGLAWGGSSDSAKTVEPESVAVLAGTGVICPGTTWTFDVDWQGPSEAFPAIEQAGVAAWIVRTFGEGNARIVGIALCAGETIRTGEMSLVVETTPTLVVNYWAGRRYGCWEEMLLPRDLDRVSVMRAVCWRSADWYGCDLGSIVANVSETGDTSYLDVLGASTDVDAEVRHGTATGVDCDFIDIADGGEDLWWIESRAFTDALAVDGDLGNMIALVDISTDAGPFRGLYWWHTCF